MSDNVFRLDLAARRRVNRATVARDAAAQTFSQRDALRSQMIDLALHVQQQPMQFVAVVAVDDEAACRLLEQLTDQQAALLRRLEAIHEQYAQLARGKAGV